MPFPALSKAIKIFFSYASTAPKDKDYFDQLTNHLSVLQDEQLIDTCYDSAIAPGDNIFQLIETYLKAADIIVLLISPDFFATKRCYELEMKRALELAEAGAAQIIPVILHPIYWENLPIAQYNALPPGGNPISLWQDVDDALSQVVRGIHQVIQKLTNQTKRSDPTPSQSSLLSIPYRRNSFFTDRESIFETLSSSFRPKEGAILALSGMDGMGKTQIALEYSYRSLQHYRTILWLNAPSHEILSAEVGLLADRLALAGRERMNEQQIFEAVKRWLENQSALAPTATGVATTTKQNSTSHNLFGYIKIRPMETRQMQLRPSTLSASSPTARLSIKRPKTIINAPSNCASLPLVQTIPK